MTRRWQVLGLAAGSIGVLVLASAMAGWRGVGRVAAARAVPALVVPMPAQLDAAEIAALRADALQARDDLRERRRAFAAASISSAGTGASIAIVADTTREQGDPLADVDLSEVATQRAVERGRHLVEAVVGCTVCHGADWQGQVLEDAWPWARVVAPDLTHLRMDQPIRALEQLRFGVRADRRSALAPCGGASALSDRELGDVWMYLQSVSRPEAPAVRGPSSEAGPEALVALGLGLVDLPADAPRRVAALPPNPGQTVAYGQHLFAAGCAWCHGGSTGLLRRGIAGRLPALDDWTEGDFSSFLASGKRPDGSRVSGMPLGVSRELGTDERKAIFAALRAR